MDTPRIIPTRRQLFAGFFSVGLSGFGGVLPLAYRMLVQQRHWLTEEEFAEYLGLGQALPGPNIVNISVAVGSRFHGAVGSCIALAGLMLAPMVIVLMLAAGYERYQTSSVLRGVIAGISAVGAGLIIAVGLRMATKVERQKWAMLLAVLTFLVIAIWRCPLFEVLLVMAPFGLLCAWKTSQKGNG